MSRVPSETPFLSIAMIAAELESAAIFERKVLSSLVEQPLRLRASTHDFIVSATETRITALECAADAFRGFVNLPAAMQLALGILPEVRQ